jgi:hypothetical protein
MSIVRSSEVDLNNQIRRIGGMKLWIPGKDPK